MCLHVEEICLIAARRSVINGPPREWVVVLLEVVDAVPETGAVTAVEATELLVELEELFSVDIPGISEGWRRDRTKIQLDQNSWQWQCADEHTGRAADVRHSVRWSVTILARAVECARCTQRIRRLTSFNHVTYNLNTEVISKAWETARCCKHSGARTDSTCCKLAMQVHMYV